MRRLRDNWVGVLVAALLALGGFVAVISIGGGGEGSETITVTVNASPRDGVPTTTIEVPKERVEDAESANPDLQQRDETPKGQTPEQRRAVQKQADKIRATQPALPTAGASAGFSGCVTRFVRNQSSRGGIRPQWQVLHYTVSRNVAGWSDVNAIVALFDRSSAQASSNFIIDAEGHCAYIVPIEAKSWTQAAANPFSVSYEVINSGSERTFMGTAGYARLKSVMTQVERRTGIPRRAGGNRGCVPTKRGTVQHADFGLCGGGHHDIHPFSKADVIRRVSAPVQTRKQRIRAARLAQHSRTHKRLKSCSSSNRSKTCDTLRRRNRNLHAALKKAGK